MYPNMFKIFEQLKEKYMYLLSENHKNQAPYCYSFSAIIVLFLHAEGIDLSSSHNTIYCHEATITTGSLIYLKGLPKSSHPSLCFYVSVSRPFCTQLWHHIFAYLWHGNSSSLGAWVKTILQLMERRRWTSRIELPAAQAYHRYKGYWSRQNRKLLLINTGEVLTSFLTNSSFGCLRTVRSYSFLIVYTYHSLHTFHLKPN